MAPMSTADTLPTFLVIGAMKAGTTTLHELLAGHPDVFMSALKEPDFFVESKNWDRGLDWYRSLFADGGGHTAIGESSTSYSKRSEFPGVPERTLGVLPDVKLVYLLRDPLERIRSMYVHNRLHGRERRPIGEAVRHDPMYVDASRYAWQLQAWLDHIDLDRVCVLRTEDLTADPQASADRLWRFLGVGPHTVARAPEAHVTAGRLQETAASRALRRIPGFERLRDLLPEDRRRRLIDLVRRSPDDDLGPLPDDVRAELRERLAPDAAELRRLLGADFDAWGLDR